MSGPANKNKPAASSNWLKRSCVNVAKMRIAAARMKSVRSLKPKHNASVNWTKSKRLLRPVALPPKPLPTHKRAAQRVAAKKPHQRPMSLRPLFLVPLVMRMQAKPQPVKKAKTGTCYLNWVVV